MSILHQGLTFKIEDAEEVMELVRKNVDLKTWKQKFVGDDKENGDAFDQSFESLIDVAYKEAKLR